MKFGLIVLEMYLNYFLFLYIIEINLLNNIFLKKFILILFYKLEWLFSVNGKLI